MPPKSQNTSLISSAVLGTEGKERQGKTPWGHREEEETHPGRDHYSTFSKELRAWLGVAVLPHKSEG